MKKYNDIPVKVRIPAMMGIASLVVFGLVCVFLLIPLRSGALEDSSRIAQLSAEVASERLSERINGAASVLRAYTGIVAQLVESDVVPPEERRKLLFAQLGALGENEERMSNVWCILEPDVLDGMDSLYVNRVGSNAQGRFTPWIADGTLANVDHLIGAPSYIVPKTTGNEMISEPYVDDIDGVSVQMFSITVPIMHNGRFLGVVGTDFYAKELAELVASLDLNAVGRLCTDKGTLAIHTDLARFGLPAEHGNREILDRLPEGKAFSGMYLYEGSEVYKAYVPMQLGNGTKPWFYAVDIPKDQIYAQARKTVGYLIVYCTIAVVMIALMGLLLVRPVMIGVTSVTGIIRELARGHINLHINERQSKDEIGEMNNELRMLVNDMKNMANFAHNIGEGNLNAEYQVMSEEDVLGNSLLEMRESLQKAETKQIEHAKEEEQRNWATSGLAKFAEILRQDNNNLEELSYNVISNMVKYLKINQGGIFVMNEAENEEERMLEMTACYAFDRKKFVQKQIRPGEGLVGACYLEGEPIYMTEIPEKYINITSGLGEANPKAVLICPLKVNDQIFGVMELASFKKFEPHQLEFVQKVAESIASTISSVKVNIRTNRLLEQTKTQTEEMAGQEEELRQNMEEMQSTQEEMRRREVELQRTLEEMSAAQESAKEKEYEMQQFYDAIYRLNNVVEFSSDAIIVAANQSLLEVLHTQKSDLIGKHLRDIVGEEAFKAAWANLEQGKPYEDVQEAKVNGTTKKVRQKFLSLCNNQGNLLKAFLLVFPE